MISYIKKKKKKTFAVTRKNKNKHMENKDIKFLNKNMQKLLRQKQTATKQF